MRLRTALLLSLMTCLCLLAIGLIAQQGATEAPTGFDTPTLQAQNAGTQSSSNGFPEPTGDTFMRDQQIFEKREDNSLGLGPVFNATSCSECHQNPVSGGASQITEIRVGHRDDNGNFVNPVVTINGGTISGRSLINDRAICPDVQEHVPDAENIRTLRAVLNTLGDGFVEAIQDNTLMAIADAQPTLSGGAIHGEAIQVPILEAPGQTRIGRFGWKDQHGSLLSFTADAYLNEMGITSRLKPVDMTSICKITKDPEDTPDAPDHARWSGHQDTGLYIGCPDVDGAYAFLRAKGVEVTEPNVTGYGMKQIYLKDPDGFGICFQWRADRPVAQPGDRDA